MGATLSRGKLTKHVSQKRPRAISAEPISLKLSDTTGHPVFVQIRDNVRDLITSGGLLAGMRLPPVRALARQLSVNQTTVAKAYRELVDAGFVEGRRGGGSFVRAAQTLSKAQMPEVSAGPLLAERLFELARAPGVIAFTSNYPAIDENGAADFRECIKFAASEKLDSCFRYDPPHGRPELRRQIQLFLAAQSINADPDNIIVTSGAQQAIDLSVRALVPPDATVIVERPAYYGAINALRSVRARILEVPVEHDGLNLDVVRTLLKREQVRFIYTNPTFQNPTGATMSEEKRRSLLSLVHEFNAVLFEDDHSPELRFSGNPIRAIRSSADESAPVLYARGFGKVFLPGSRLGFLVVPDALRSKLLMAKAHTDLHTNSFIQEAAAHYLATCDLAKVAQHLRDKFSQRQRLLYDGLRSGMPAGTTVSQPEGGLSLWLTLPQGANVSELYFRAVRRGVAFVAGDVFYATPSDSRSLRVSFGLNPPGELHEGIERLCFVVKDLLNRRETRAALV